MNFLYLERNIHQFSIYTRVKANLTYKLTPLDYNPKSFILSILLILLINIHPSLEILSSHTKFGGIF